MTTYAVTVTVQNTTTVTRTDVAKDCGWRFSMTDERHEPDAVHYSATSPDIPEKHYTFTGVPEGTQYIANVSKVILLEDGQYRGYSTPQGISFDVLPPSTTFEVPQENGLTVTWVKE